MRGEIFGQERSIQNPKFCGFGVLEGEEQWCMEGMRKKEFKKGKDSLLKIWKEGGKQKRQ